MTTALEEGQNLEGKQQQAPQMVTEVRRILGELGIELSQRKLPGRENPYHLEWDGSDHHLLLRLSENEKGKIDSLSLLKNPKNDLENPKAAEEIKVSGIESYLASKIGDFLDLTLTLGTEQQVVQKVKIDPQRGYFRTITYPKNS